VTTYYKEIKDPRGLLAKFDIPLGVHHIACYIWETRANLLGNVNFIDDDLDACYAYYPQRKIMGGLFGEMHFVISVLDPGIAAHELTHVLLDWMKSTLQIQSIYEKTERICDTMETMTGDFWNHYQDHFVDELSSEQPTTKLTIDEIPASELSVGDVSDVGKQAEPNFKYVPGQTRLGGDLRGNEPTKQRKSSSK
jgi:hypothetical protein